jgi:hypothetical protein
VIVGVLVTTSQVMAAIVSDRQHSGYRGSIESLAVQEPGLDRDDRIMYRATIRNRLPQTQSLRLDTSIHIAPDSQAKSKRVKIDHDLYYASSIASIEYAQLFRFSAGIGPIVSYERSTITVGSDSNIINFTDFGVLIRGDIDYAFSRSFEANFDLGWQSRIRAAKNDWSYGFGFGMNF